VGMPVRAFGEPIADQFGLVARSIVHDDMNVEIVGHIALDRVEEAAELGRTMTRHASADDGSGLHVQCGKQRRRTVPLVVMSAPFGLPRAHRQDRLGSVERLNLRPKRDPAGRDTGRRYRAPSRRTGGRSKA
jgi:hypothetical protein